jgi:hypothetical protein
MVQLNSEEVHLVAVESEKRTAFANYTKNSDAGTTQLSCKDK